MRIVEQILDLARWAPSGDNTQPWRFEIVDDAHVIVHGFDTRDHVVYDLDGHASQLALGALVETVRIAATTKGLRTDISRRPDTPESHLLFDVRFAEPGQLQADPLAPFITTRVVQRRPMSTRPLTQEQKVALERALPEGYRVLWFEGWGERWRMARFMFDNARIRLTIPEAFEVHRSIIEWGAQISEDRVPGRAIGVDPMTERFMHWAMASWERVEFLNTYFLGHLPPRIQLDLLPGVFCAAHFALLAPKPLRDIDDYIAAGRAMQRFWLTAASVCIFIQPEMTPVIFTRYHREGRAFTRMGTVSEVAGRLNGRLTAMLAGQQSEALFFMGRLGTGPAPQARSSRLPLSRLLVGSND